MKAKDEIIKSIKLQQEQFGDDLYTRLKIPKFEDKRSIPSGTGEPGGLSLSQRAQQAGRTGASSFSQGSYQPQKQHAALKAHDAEGTGKAYQPGSPEYPTQEVIDSAVSLDDLESKINHCLKCPLGASRKNFVFGEGNPNARVMLIGEGPGADEDAKGRPFVGRAGQLLTDILKAINFSREEVYIANIVKCRPPGNRTPFDSEIAECRPYLQKQIELIKPDFILCLGGTAVQALLERKGTLGNFRNKVFNIHGAQMMATFHPAALLRNPNWKHDTWADVQAFRKLYDEKYPN